MIGPRILVVDDDPDIRVFLEVTLQVNDFEAVTATDGEEAVQVAIERQPDLIVMDVMMPRLDGIGALQRLRADGRTSHIPVILVTAKAQATDKVEGLESGADDYVTKPFDPEELVARIHATLRRAGQMRSASPLTGLPGNARIEQELARRIATDERFALLYADLNHFKPYNDHYGWLRGDEVLRFLATVIREAAAEHGGPETFVGHVGGDDFVVITAPDHIKPIAEGICKRFDAGVTDLYDDEDAERGYIEVHDRQGVLTRFAPVSVSIGITHNRNHVFTHHNQPVALATEMKSFAKAEQADGSNWAVDRRADEEVA